MELTTLTNGIFGSNTYIVESDKQCAIIDCGNKPQDIKRVIDSKGLHPKYIILTHGHADHIFYAGRVKDVTGALICLHKDDLPLYSDSDKNGYNLFGFNSDFPNPYPDCLLKHGDKLPLGDVNLEIIHTPGHSPGCISILCEDMLFSGDTLFQLSVGRTDLYGGSPKQIVESIKTRLYTLDGSVTVYPGHGMSTTIAYERENNPYV
ncbi:MAG: MBL fold metallo-hydrolase [Acetivibrionales bacterium]|jgi:hydroxyacylglutathione hydrolase|nr:MBL fold metallo-hydrolase [Clostridiaceae bacterium]